MPRKINRPRGTRVRLVVDGLTQATVTPRRGELDNALRAAAAGSIEALRMVSDPYETTGAEPPPITRHRDGSASVTPDRCLTVRIWTDGDEGRLAALREDAGRMGPGARETLADAIRDLADAVRELRDAAQKMGCDR